MEFNAVKSTSSFHTGFCTMCQLSLQTISSILLSGKTLSYKVYASINYLLHSSQNAKVPSQSIKKKVAVNEAS